MKPGRMLSGLLMVLALVAGAMWWLRREEASALHSEMALLRDEQREFEKLQSENRNLRASQIAPADLERLRADRAAIDRLRAELEKLRASVERAGP